MSSASRPILSFTELSGHSTLQLRQFLLDIQESISPYGLFDDGFSDMIYYHLSFRWCFYEKRMHYLTLYAVFDVLMPHARRPLPSMPKYSLPAMLADSRSSHFASLNKSWYISFTYDIIALPGYFMRVLLTTFVIWLSDGFGDVSLGAIANIRLAGSITRHFSTPFLATLQQNTKIIAFSGGMPTRNSGIIYAPRLGQVMLRCDYSLSGRRCSAKYLIPQRDIALSSLRRRRNFDRDAPPANIAWLFWLITPYATRGHYHASPTGAFFAHVIAPPALSTSLRYLTDISLIYCFLDFLSFSQSHEALKTRTNIVGAAHILMIDIII